MSDFDVTPAEVQRLVDDGAVLVDVREDDEWVACYAPDSLHIPLAELVEQFDDLPDDRVVVFVCRSGGRSAHAAGFLIQQGYEARNLAGGLIAWAADGLPIVTDTGGPGKVL